MSIEIMIMIIIMLIFLIYTFINLYLNKRKIKKNINKNENNIKNIMVSYTISDIYKDIDDMIIVYLESYIFKSELQEFIRLTDKELVSETEKISIFIIEDMSPIFKSKIELFLTTEATQRYIVRKVMQNLTTYAARVNKLK